jgi:hypothetical protein
LIFLKNLNDLFQFIEAHIMKRGKNENGSILFIYLFFSLSKVTRFHYDRVILFRVWAWEQLETVIRKQTPFFLVIRNALGASRIFNCIMIITQNTRVTQSASGDLFRCIRKERRIIYNLLVKMAETVKLFW